MNYSKYQVAIFDWVKNVNKDNKHLVVESGPGSGKTTTIIEACNYIPKNQKTMLTSFSKLIADNLGEILQRKGLYHVRSSTLNSFGWSVCNENVKGIIFNKWKDDNILNKYINEAAYKKSRYVVKKLIGLMKNHIITESDGVVESMMRLVRENNIELPERVQNFNEAFEQTYLESINTNHIMNYDDQKFQPVFRNWPIPRFDWLLVDESQDNSLLDTELISRILGIDDKNEGHGILVGDVNQCQPIGTMINVVKQIGNKWNKPIIEKLPIENLKVNDIVVSWDRNDRQWKRNKKVKEISSRKYNGDLIVIKTLNGDISKYTPNHNCIIKFSYLTQRYCVYLMLKNGNYRIGKVKFNYGECGNGLTHRLRAEKADMLWILSVHDTHNQAFLKEQIISNQYNIPQLIFNRTNSSTMTQNDIDYFWNIFGGNEDKAKLCLIEHGRDINYPIMIKNDIKNNLRLTSSLKTQACNLIDECLILPYERESEYLGAKNQERLSHTFQYEWVPITVSREHYEGLVYSLDIEENHTYVADGILTSNSIYKFRGSDANSLEKIKTRFKAKVLPLPICYRCPTDVIDEAMKIKPNGIEHPEINANGKGHVETINKIRYEELVDTGNHVYCRTVAPLIKYCLKMLTMKRKAFVKGREIGDGLINLINTVDQAPNGRQQNLDINLFEGALNAYHCEQTTILTKLNREDAITLLEDQVDSLKALIPNCANVVELISLIKTIIVDDGVGIVFMTLHKCKGLENPNIFIIRRDLVPHPKARGEEQLTQEDNLLFIGITRSQQNLYFVTKDKNER